MSKLADRIPSPLSPRSRTYVFIQPGNENKDAVRWELSRSGMIAASEDWGTPRTSVRVKSLWWNELLKEDPDVVSLYGENAFLDETTIIKGYVLVEEILGGDSPT